MPEPDDYYVSLQHAQAALRDMEIERNMLRISLADVLALAEAGDACGAVGCRALADRDKAEAAIERVRQVHAAEGVDGYWCTGCFYRYPCATIRALSD